MLKNATETTPRTDETAWTRLIQNVSTSPRMDTRLPHFSPDDLSLLSSTIIGDKPVTPTEMSTEAHSAAVASLIIARNPLARRAPLARSSDSRVITSESISGNEASGLVPAQTRALCPEALRSTTLKSANNGVPTSGEMTKTRGVVKVFPRHCGSSSTAKWHLPFCR